jgi:hypothetical protein
VTSRKADSLRAKVPTAGARARWLDHRLLDSLKDRGVASDHDELSRVWAKETARRAAQIDAGDVTMQSWDDVLERVAESHREW